MKICIFEIFVVDDSKFDQFYLYQNLWRETLLLNKFNHPSVPKMLDFGIIPNRLISKLKYHIYIYKIYSLQTDRRAKWNYSLRLH